MLVTTPFPGFVRIKPVITTGLKYVETQKTQQQQVWNGRFTGLTTFC